MTSTIFLFFIMFTCFLSLNQINCKYSHHWPGNHSLHDIPQDDSGLWRALKDNEKAIVKNLPFKVVDIMYAQLRVSSKLTYRVGVKVHRHPKCGKRFGKHCYDAQFCQAEILIFSNGTNRVVNRDCNKDDETD